MFETKNLFTVDNIDEKCVACRGAILCLFLANISFIILMLQRREDVRVPVAGRLCLINKAEEELSSVRSR